MSHPDRNSIPQTDAERESLSIRESTETSGEDLGAESLEDSGFEGESPLSEFE